MSQPNNSGAYYFLGNITSHILHALPLWRELGGTFVVTSNKARETVENLYNVPVINLDDIPYKWMMPGRRPKRVYHYTSLDRNFKKTYEFLNDHAKVVIFYELFELEKPKWLNRPKKIFLTHGNMLKSYMTMYPKRLQIVEDYDYMAALGPYMKQQFITDGVSPEKLIDIGVARTDEVIKNNGKIIVSKSIIETLGIDPSKTIVSYMPTFWGASSIFHTGIEIIHNIPSDYTLIFRPHPQTPKKLLKQYIKLIRSRPNIVYAPEGKYKTISLIDVFNASSLIIGDVSSVMLEAIMTYKPLLFAYDDEINRQSETEYRAIRQVVELSQSIYPGSGASIQDIIEVALQRGVDKKVWGEVIEYNFFNPHGNSVESITQFIHSIES